ncbi:MAG: PLP-dependent aminotransferase family protein [Sphingosinicella sp.]|nr:PLP-dependent aminotransferase family protein [Sphingosinicella sp.]
MTDLKMGAASLARMLGEWRAVNGRTPAHRQLNDILRLLILDGRLPLGARLPGERKFGDVLGLSRTTVSAAYAALRAEGYLSSRHGSGSFTCLPQGPWSRAPVQLDGEGEPGHLEFSVATLPATEHVHAAYAAALAALPAHLPGSGYGAYGLPELRAVIADRYERRGVPTSPEQIFVTQGAQHGFALMLGLMARPGDRIAVDHPTYALALDAIQRASCKAAPMPLSDAGWDPEAMEDVFRRSEPKMAYLQADFHNPTGQLMTDEVREAIIRVAARTKTLLVVDETMADLWLDHAPPPPLAGFDSSDRVVTLGSTSKTFWGGLRIGWVRAGAQIVAGLARVRASMDLGTPILEQLAGSFLLAHPDSILDPRREALRRRRDHLLRIVAYLLPDWRLSRPAGGLAVWAELPAPRSTILAAAAQARGLRIAPGTRFGVDGAFERFVRLPFSLPEDKLTQAMHRLTSAWNEIGEVPPRRSRSEISDPRPVI